MSDSFRKFDLESRCKDGATRFGPDDDFELINDSLTRIRCLYPHAKKVLINTYSNQKKDLRQAEFRRTEGNDCFRKKMYGQALKYYNQGVITCPQDSGKFYFFNKAKCFDMLNDKQQAYENFELAKTALMSCNFDGRALHSKKKEIEQYQLQLATSFYNIGFNIYTPTEETGKIIPHEKYKALTELATIEESKVLGRYAVAVQDIPVGTMILEENPHAVVLSCENWLKNCQYCCASIKTIVPCRGCPIVGFCSTKCENLAHKSFHKYECGILASLINNDPSINCLLALRLITKQHINTFKDKYNKYKGFFADKCSDHIFRKKPVYKSDDYDMVFSLCRNERSTHPSQLRHWTFMAIHLLRVLKLSNFFGPEPTHDDIITDDEVYIGALMLRHFQMLQYNSHEISELRNVENPVVERGMKSFYANVGIGAALYPTLALFNHSCDPSIARYNINSKIVVKAIKPIKAGQPIYENYGPLYMSEGKLERQRYLLDKYIFTCKCNACTKNWPLFDEMEKDLVAMKCCTSSCPQVFTFSMTDEPIIGCPSCKACMPILNGLASLMHLEVILANAEESFMKADFAEAAEGFCKALEMLFKATVPPHAEIVMVQQRYKSCLIHYGNAGSRYICRLGH
ncbi:unnamed protein product [Brassicogethes aeneus]|uniref:Protein-lysine N-methyltransferase SMYD4 n=1 Tax=Brassicogethes aeneus TaxID=1431903 RepID=A0A9P0FND5_BRAAE|nr:unnamed protein product [Brassicogethes aeneus]